MTKVFIFAQNKPVFQGRYQAKRVPTLSDVKEAMQKCQGLRAADAQNYMTAQNINYTNALKYYHIVETFQSCYSKSKSEDRCAIVKIKVDIKF